MSLEMSKTWNIAANEFSSIVFKKSFVVSLLILPLLLTAILIVGIIKSAPDTESPAVGYIDKAGLLEKADKADMESAELKPVPFATPEAAKKALDNGEIQVYFEIPAGFPDKGPLAVNFVNTPSRRLIRQFQQYLRMAMLGDYPDAVRNRAVKGFALIKRSLDGSRQMLRDPSINQVLPLFIAFSFIFLIFLTSGYLMQAVAVEKENRTMEILITTVSPGQLIRGKVAGIIGAGLTLFLSWFLFTAGFIIICGHVLGISWFRAIAFDGKVLLMLLAVTLPTYILVAAMMVGIGTAIAEAREGTQASFLFLILLVLPFYFIQPLTADPDGLLAIALSVAPFTSLMAMVFRNMFITIPDWQVILGVLVASVSALFAIRLAVASFQSGLLNYGKSFSWKGFLSRIKHRKASKGESGS